MSRTTVTWRTIQSLPSAVWLTFVLPALRMEEAVGGGSKHHHLPLLGNPPTHHHALGFPQQLVQSPAEVKNPSRVEHPSKLEQGLSNMVHVPRVYQGLYGPCATWAMKRAMLCGRPGLLDLPNGKAHLHCLLQPHHTVVQTETQDCTSHQLPTDNALGKAAGVNLQFSSGTV